MIDVGRMTGNEREVLHAALVAYDTMQAERARDTKLETVHSDVRWRRYIIAMFLEKVDG